MRPERQYRIERESWAPGRRHDGFYLIVVHPDLSLPAAELVDLYFSKDLIEKGFRIIKSELELRPVSHRTDAKVRAHVSLCILALLVVTVRAHWRIENGTH
ncbi:MAG: transposase [Candidatus Schekmanbacteria bacterium]|nr:transposase [Candidatus Schekmanbacteria bacterium]